MPYRLSVSSPEIPPVATVKPGEVCVSDIPCLLLPARSQVFNIECVGRSQALERRVVSPLTDCNLTRLDWRPDWE